MDSRLIITMAERNGRLMPTLIRPAPVAIGPMILNKTPAEVVEICGRVFNLCRHAQEGAARLALGLPLPSGAPIHDEILRDAVFRLFIALPAAMGRPATPPPAGWQGDRAGLATVLLGGADPFPRSWRGFRDWLAAGAGLAPLIATLERLFAPGEAACPALPLFDAPGTACENSAAARHARHPAMRAIERDRGRGPLWRTVARLLDVEAALAGGLPQPRLIAPGIAEAPAARGRYRISVAVAGGRVVALHRRTPTDDMCRPDGALMLSLAALPVAKRHLAPLVIECLDPCLPWHVQEVQHA